MLLDLLGLLVGNAATVRVIRDLNKELVLVAYPLAPVPLNLSLSAM
jgi:hypothetical protein